MPQICTPERASVTPVQTMISSRSGRISRTALRETIFRRGLRRPFVFGCLASTGRISPLGRERYVSTT